MTIRNKVLRSSMLPAALLALFAVSPASAQYYDWQPNQPPAFNGRIPPQHIESMVRSMGFQPVAEPRPRGPLWVTHAVDRDGQQVRVLIDSFTGRVIDVLRRPLPPQRVAIVPPANMPQHQNAPLSDYDDGPDYDYRDMPRNRRPADWPPSRPNAQQQQQQYGPTVIPLDPRSDNNRVPSPPKNSTAKKKETKDKKNDATAALTPEKDKQNPPSPKARPADAPKPDAQKSDAPKTAQTPKMPAADTQRAPDPQTTGAVTPPVQPLDTKKDQPNTGPFPVQPPF